ncbi:GNAT family N-acetyltransferase [Kineosporia sp. R_H_3]|uniref:GNAT family N-acetyltransferase n=1 Tax=Kineosporia sp. R_H_3 TaxID=1961848 RepID=UPI001E392041|nr:GNAT family N-acetyltransferase [Kineosporia sp. R_H_3]
MLRSSLRLLDRHDVAEALAVCDRDVAANLFVAARLSGPGFGNRAGGGELWGYHDSRGLASLCWSGANLVPVQADEEAVDAFADRARRQGRNCSSIVGPADAVLALWRRLEPYWGPAREVRAEQPLMALEGPPVVAPDPRVRRSRLDELDLVVPACVAMFTEEVGYSPVAQDGGALYHAQVTSLVAGGRSLVRIDDVPGAGGRREVVFKAELGSVTQRAVQVQGVWVNPRHRGRGLAAPGMAAVARVVQAEVAPLVTLYVNGYNVRAVRTYERVGFRRVGTFATVLF